MATKGSSPNSNDVLADALKAFGQKSEKSEVIEGKIEGKSEPPKADKSSNRSSRLRSKNWMITEQLDYFTKKDDESWKDFFTRLCESDERIIDWAFIIHNADTYTKQELEQMQAEGQDITGKKVGDLKAEHVHIVIKYDGAVRLSAVAKLFNVPTQQVVCETEKKKQHYAFENFLSYLTHRTPGSQTKHQYDFDEVVYHFADGRSYAEHMADTAKNVKRAETRKKHENFDELLSQYMAGKISYTALQALASDANTKLMMAKENRWLKPLQALQDEQEALKFFEIFNQPQRVIWLKGDSGAGKTLAANKMAEFFAKKRFPNEPALGNSYVQLGSSRGLFEGYNSTVHVAILDDLRPYTKQITYDDLLRIFDPNEKGKRYLPGRYHDRLQATSVIIVTSSYDPAEFAYRMLGAWQEIVQRLYVGTEKLDGTGKPPYGDSHDSEMYQIPFSQITKMQLDDGTWLDRWESVVKTNPNRRNDTDEMRRIYDNGLKGVQAIQTPGAYYYGREVELERHKDEPWNLCESPVQLMRRVHAYEVSTNQDDEVTFTKLIPIQHDDGFCDYQKEATPFRNNLSLEEVWECREFADNDNPFVDSWPKQDQAMTDLDYFLLKNTRTELIVHKPKATRRIDQSFDTTVEVKRKVLDSLTENLGQLKELLGLDEEVS